MPAVPRDPPANCFAQNTDLEAALIEARCFLRVIELATDDRAALDRHDAAAISLVAGCAAGAINTALDRNDKVNQ
ncbi:hypothetical protein RUR49_19030 [Pseudoxanthobacter sp. M-2]|uniref:hypothetical protein n=1 Tax=Pseudoxanthobacter sp. M-2 TaxID=3078754 RepID=UPI0038FD3613